MSDSRAADHLAAIGGHLDDPKRDVGIGAEFLEQFDVTAAVFSEGRALAERGHYPALDVTRSISRLMNRLASPEQRKVVDEMRKLLAHYEEKRDFVTLGAYESGSDPVLDRALQRLEPMLSFLRQKIF